MIKFLFVVVLFSSPMFAFGAPSPNAVTPPVNATAPSSLLGVSTMTVSMLYTGDRVRDPFMPFSMGFVVRERDKNAPFAVDIHALQLRGILKDQSSDFAIFRTDEGTSLVLRGGRLYDHSNKAIRGITGRIHIKQRRAELITEDKDVQIYTLGETDEDHKDGAAKP